MKTRTATLLVSLAYLQATVAPAFAADAQVATLTEKQKDDLIAIDLIQKNPAEAERITAIGLATEYANNHHLGLRVMHELTDVPTFSLNPWEFQTYKQFFEPTSCRTTQSTRALEQNRKRYVRRH